MKNNKILFVLPTLAMGGAEKMTINIANNLDKNLFEVKIIVIDNSYNDLASLIDKNIEVIFLKIKRTRYSFFELLKLLLKEKPNILFSSTNRTNILVLLTKIILWNIKVIIREPSMPSLQIQNQNISKFKLKLIKFLYPFALKIIAQTKYMEKEIVKYFGIKSKKVVAMKNILDIGKINKLLNNIQLYDQTKHNFVCVGGLRKEKNQLDLVKMFKKVIDIDSSFILHLIGDGSLKWEIEQYIKENKLEKNIILYGLQKNPYNYIKQADCLILSSIWEGMPNVVNEALYLKTPVITTNCTPILKELINNYSNGILLESTNLLDIKDAILSYKNIRLEFEDIQNDDYNNFFWEVLNDQS